jgi:hypothetical protein
MIGIIVMFILIVVVKFTAHLDFGCWLIGGFIALFAGIILHQLIEFKRDLNQFVCPFCADGSLCKSFCKSIKIYTIVAVVLSFIMSVSLLSFLILTDALFLAFVFLDIFIFYYIFTRWNRLQTKELVEDAKKVGSEAIINFLNVLVLIIALVSLELSNIKDVQFTPEIFEFINENVVHSCKIFRHILRTKEFMELSMYAIRNIGEIGAILFTFLYISSLSVFPMTAITLLYKFGIKIEYKIKSRSQHKTTEVKNDEKNGD